MKLSELKRVVDLSINASKYNEDSIVSVIVKLPYSTVGAHPMVTIKSASCGFDWENGKFLLWPEEDLTYHNREFKEKYNKLLDDHYKLQREFKALKDKK